MALSGTASARRGLGRLRPDADTPAAAVVLLGAVHHLVFTGRSATARFPDEVRRVVDAVPSGLA